ncbi:3-methyl-2-oxobutanoate hydroxymethyltransferase [Halieaceae bacterium IMCC14734]|uniref:3-methyl-2-oxobutanoate hydroxymethyltransferase n=1 Tax=Candidatus Litorirhabdus singularis TaxID=2518993 RepID=A0ABT3TNX0_9GAMM|nr:3-methyl-2-oxobutanoate hydroxymethyltransferase [Candidatus Litorirhabdus singularis]MCX2983084.1 3-methyl-2-oxobutanoate hydroxymethyltransferase [Candidatus Litorirhabdus singularis]
MANVSVKTLQDLKEQGEKFCCITAYDATFSRLISEAGAETMLVGDSLGMVLQGHESTVPVTIDDMAYHTASVARGNRGAMIMADMPFMSYATAEQAMVNATSLMQAGAQMVKMEGGTWLSGTIEKLVERGIPVCAHLGLTPQSVNVFGGYRVQGRTPKGAKSILADAVEIQDAGASLLVLECVPSELATDISEKLTIPVIGIGAGPGTDAQVLVMHDMLGLAEHNARFVENFMAGADSIQEALAAFVAAVKSGAYPRPEQAYS